MASNIKIVGASSIEEIIREDLKQSEIEILYASKDAAKKAANDTAKVLRQISPKRRGKYRKGWKVANEGYDYIVYNASLPGLTHLLEHGHGNAKPIEHIKTAESLGIYEFEKEVVNEINRRLSS